MGAGKTAAALTAFSDLYDQNKVNTLWVIAPKRVALTVWAQEVDDWAHLRDLTVSVVVGDPVRRAKRLAADVDIYVTTYELVPWLLLQRPKGFDDQTMIVLDELTRIKSPKSVRAKDLNKLIKNTRYRVGLTGTPRPRDDQDLYNQVLTIHGPDTSWGKSFYAWRKTHFYTTDYQGYDWQPKPGHDEKLRDDFARFSFRVEPPPMSAPIVIVEPVTLSRPVMEAHEEALKEAVLKFGSVENVLANSAVGMLKARQIAGGTFLDDTGQLHVVHDEKLEVLRDIVEDSGEPVLVIYGFRGEVQLMRSLWPDMPVLGGLTNANLTPDIVHRWNQGRLPILAGHPLAMGHGLNLQAGGRRIVFWTAPWSIEERSQTIARLWRQGQTKQVYVHDLIATGTVDMAVYARLAKRADAQDVLLAMIRNAAGKQAA
jgi:SNF2 family DNA or RNA helicase